MARQTKTEKDALAHLKAEYEVVRAKAERFRECIASQILSLLDQNGATLGVPMETRVKLWDSIEEKITRKSLSVKSLSDIRDLIGIRTILLFKRDLNLVDSLIKSNFEVISVEDTGTKLSETQFGYQSQHYIVKISPAWQKVPIYHDLGDMVAEIQVRTVAQHIWAAASHKLQYKREESVPPPT